MLYTRHLGFKNFEAALAAGDPKAVELRAVVASVEDEILAHPRISARAAYRFFPAHSDGDRTLMVYAADGKRVLEHFIFGRQIADPGLCLADYVTAGRVGPYRLYRHDGDDDCRRRPRAGRGMEGSRRISAVAYPASARARGGGGIHRTAASEDAADVGYRRSAGTHDKDLFQAHYHGKRYSFGYPACPRLEDQAQLFRLLELEQSGLGLHLTEGYMMDPESSVSALVLHNPEG